MMGYGPTFADELHAAGLSGLPIGWTRDAITGRDKLSADQDARLAAVIAAHVESSVRTDDVDAERDRRLSSFTFGGRSYDFDPASRHLIDKAKGSALAAIILGAQVGDLRWAEADIDFAWIAADNTSVPMDAQTALAFGTAAAAWEGRHILTARALKDMAPIPADYTHDRYWPAN